MSPALQAPVIGPHTVADWLALDPPVDGSRLELIFGYCHPTPAPSGEQQTAAFLFAVRLREALCAADRRDLWVAPAVNVEISTAWRTVLIPDVVVLNREAVGVTSPADALVLAVEIWSPGNSRAERETKMAGYADAGVPFLWTIDLRDDLRGLRLTAYRLENGQYQAETTMVESEGPASIAAGPVPVTLDLAELSE